ncbi:MAG TPA: cyclodeaminase/cyclohydrolase family protein [Gemmatimonadales bacterium]|nr:cyclodeaminase/cyclohydrolase family protein [Gemmatimonadales bacterium]
MTESDDSIAGWVDALAAPTATPAGGSAAAIGAALAGGLVEMVARLTTSRESYADIREKTSAAADRARWLRGRLLALAAEDANTFREVMEATALPRDTEAEIARRNAARADALKGAAGVQYELLLLAAEVADLGEELVARGLRSAVGDAASAVFLAAAACRSAHWAIRSNLHRLYDDRDAERMMAAALERLEGVAAVEKRVVVELSERL